MLIILGAHLLHSKLGGGALTRVIRISPYQVVNYLPSSR